LDWPQYDTTAVKIKTSREGGAESAEAFSINFEVVACATQM
jgi:hypothetical protein